MFTTMKIIGLSGGIASGKNFVADIFAQNGAVIFDADLEVHKLMESDKSTITAIQKNFPECFFSKKIDRMTLGKIIFNDEKKLRILEKILHPQIQQACQKFLQKAQQENQKIALLNIPLLLESKSYSCDKVIAVIASPSIRKKRFLARAKRKHPTVFAAEKKNLEKKFEKICKRQLSNKDRKIAADFVVNTNKSKVETIRQVKEMISKVEGSS